MSDYQQTLESIAIEWSKGNISDRDARYAAENLDHPKKIVESDGEVWFDGNEQNSVMSLFQLEDEGRLTMKQVEDFLEVLSTKDIN